MADPRRALGTTMIELAVALGIAGTLLFIGFPAYRAWIADMEMRDCIQALVEHMSFARAEAIRRQTRVTVTTIGAETRVRWGGCPPRQGIAIASLPEARGYSAGGSRFE